MEIRRLLDSTTGMTHLVRHQRGGDHDLDALRARVRDLEATLERRDREAARTAADLDAFKAAYRRRVGALYDQLDELEHAIAEAELGELAADLGEARPSSDPLPVRDEAARFTSDAVRKLFRDVAKAIHPDLARDDRARDHRHALMIEANRAYAQGDEAQLRRILQTWERSPEAVAGEDPAAARLRLLRRLAQVEERLAAHDAAFDALTRSPLWELKARVDAASASGRDLVAEMVRRLERDVMVASNRLAAMRPPGS